jgi:hypothetical protein
MQNEQRVAPQQVIRAPQVPRGEAVRPAPAAANPHVNANKVETPNAGKGNEDRGRPATKVERDNEQQR